MKHRVVAHEHCEVLGLVWGLEAEMLAVVRCGGGNLTNGKGRNRSAKTCGSASSISAHTLSSPMARPNASRSSFRVTAVAPPPTAPRDRSRRWLSHKGVWELKRGDGHQEWCDPESPVPVGEELEGIARLGVPPPRVYATATAQSDHAGSVYVRYRSGLP